MSGNLGLLPTKQCVENMRKAFPKGTQVEAVSFDDLWHPIPKGTRGIVLSVDDIGTLHIAWEGKGQLGAVWNADVVRNLETGIKSNEFWEDYISKANWILLQRGEKHDG